MISQHLWSEDLLDWREQHGQSVPPMESMVYVNFQNGGCWLWFDLEMDGLCQIKNMLYMNFQFSNQICWGNWSGAYLHSDPMATPGHGTDDNDDDVILFLFYDVTSSLFFLKIKRKLFDPLVLFFHLICLVVFQKNAKEDIFMSSFLMPCPLRTLVIMNLYRPFFVIIS